MFVQKALLKTMANADKCPLDGRTGYRCLIEVPSVQPQESSCVKVLRQRCYYRHDVLCAT